VNVIAGNELGLHGCIAERAHDPQTVPAQFCCAARANEESDVSPNLCETTPKEPSNRTGADNEHSHRF
jgi:hypothetical protein